jgi:hypothetical protein
MYGVGCCPYEDAICCGDGVHCCPNGFVCGEYSCYSPSTNANTAFFLSNAKQNSFLENSNSESNVNNTDKPKERISEKINKTLINFTSNSKIDKVNENNLNNNNLEFLEENKPNNKVMITSTATTTTTNVKEENREKISTSIQTISKFSAILNQMNLFKNSYFEKLLGCFKNLEPIVNDLLNAYKEKNEDKTESLMKVLTELVGKLYFDGAKITSDCKAILVLAGIAGIY